MNIYIFDGSFEGFMTVSHMLIRDKAEAFSIVPQCSYSPDLFCQPCFVSTDVAAFKEILDYLEHYFPREVMRYLTRAFLSEIDGIYLKLHHYILAAIQYGREVDRYLTHDAVSAVHDAARKVGTEAHRLKGLVRFRELKDSIFYSPIAPDHNVLLSVAQHFTVRLRDQLWILHDVGRNEACFWNKTKLLDADIMDPAFKRLNSAAGIAPEKLSENELNFSNLWQTFFDHVAIPERTNSKLQRRLMPHRYWKYLTENV